ncbi:hypothetical protein BB558_004416 [Smittium angustum]|uniref:Homologous recombination OB-fold protein OB-fold domain-containing protein n=1 Tax=Smittium angustum TaxID=133377 RepID=A0A2U1J362_SMIAN|nr:hypothetical protein BB558_004416 [Smittium angustum]
MGLEHALKKYQQRIKKSQISQSNTQTNLPKVDFTPTSHNNQTINSNSTQHQTIIQNAEETIDFDFDELDQFDFIDSPPDITSSKTPTQNKSAVSSKNQEPLVNQTNTSYDFNDFEFDTELENLLIENDSHTEVFSNSDNTDKTIDGTQQSRGTKEYSQYQTQTIESSPVNDKFEFDFDTEGLEEYFVESEQSQSTLNSNNSLINQNKNALLSTDLPIQADTNQTLEKSNVNSNFSGFGSQRQPSLLTTIPNVDDNNFFKTPIQKRKRINPFNQDQNNSASSGGSNNSVEKQATVTKIVKTGSRISTSFDRGVPGPVGSMNLNFGLRINREDQTSIYDNNQGGFEEEERTASSLINDQDFDSKPWQTLLQECNIPEYKPSVLSHISRSESPYLKYSIKQAHDIESPRLFQYLLVLVREYFSSENDYSATLIDPTGEITASIHHEFFKVPGNEIDIGSAILLKNVPIMRSRNGKSYIVMTAKCTEKVFTPKYSSNNSRYVPSTL